MSFTQEDANLKIGALVSSNWILEKAVRELSAENESLKKQENKDEPSKEVDSL